MPLTLMFITNDPEIAAIAQKYGVQRIWVDLETLGKEERQIGLNTVKSRHTIEDIRKIAPILKDSELLVRVNPVNPHSREEIDGAIAAGADVVMLPMWRSLAEVQAFLEMVQNRARTVLLLETKEAVDHIDEVLEYGGFDEIHIGLNDLHLSYGLDFMFEPLTNGTVERLCEKFAKKGIPYGFGGIARIGGGMLPAEKIVMEHYRLGSTRAILSRSFCDVEHTDRAEAESIFKRNLEILRAYEEELRKADARAFETNQAEVAALVAEISKKRRSDRDG